MLFRSFAQLRQWSFHYLASLGLALANTIALIVVFRFKTQDGPSVFHTQACHILTRFVIHAGMYDSGARGERPKPRA